ncbi:hypothetical protein [Shewanella sp. 10N.286.52.B9]|uniref:hypothetical protein n=1 Tax=Shewanella sp. 10N.286.52.B9 TaxID=1880837 RepID=UPI000C821E73|nr:hypothetical protein [Shewanella sp. 10N.286.52.B9]PMG40886.1 hypothetical protein BCU91_11955 [Shewanella sp. 10N.286.52.B9]
MIAWCFAYIVSLVILHGHSASCFRAIRSEETLSKSAFIGVGIGFYLCLLSLSTVVISHMSLLENDFKIFMMVIGGVPIFISVLFAYLFRFKEERKGTQRGMYF